MKFVATKRAVTKQYLPPFTSQDVGEYGNLQHLKGFPQEGFSVKVPLPHHTGAACYDTDKDDRLNNPESKWLLNDYGKPHGASGVTGPNMKKIIENWLLEQAAKPNADVRQYVRDREPLTIEGDDAEMFRRWRADQEKKRKLAATSAGGTNDE